MCKIYKNISDVAYDLRIGRYKKIVCRELKKTDYEQYLNLINQFRETTFNCKEFKNALKRIKRNSEIWVVEFDGVLVASGTIISETKFIFNISRVAHIEDIIVHKEYRKKGFGKMILDKLKQRAKETGCYKFTLCCSDDYITGPRNFYKKCGLELRGIQMSGLTNNISD